MTKKDFEDLAMILDDNDVWNYLPNVVATLIGFCYARNPNFNERKFVEACGIDYDEYKMRY